MKLVQIIAQYTADWKKVGIFPYNLSVSKGLTEAVCQPAELSEDTRAKVMPVALYKSNVLT